MRSLLFFATLSSALGYESNTYFPSQYETITTPLDDELDLLSLSSKQMGALHNRIVMKVHDRIKEEEPQDHFEYSNIVSEEVSKLCQKSERGCAGFVYEDTVRARSGVEDLFSTDDSPDLNGLFLNIRDRDLTKNLKIIYDSVSLLKDHSMEETLDVMNEISLNIEDSDMDDKTKQKLLSVSSIAMGSTILWSEAFDDPENTFRNNHHNRLLQSAGVVSIGFNVLGVVFDYVSADVMGAIRGVISLTPNIFSVVRTSLTWSLEVVGIYIPYPMDLVTCFLGEVTDFSNPIAEFLLPSECNATVLFGPTVGGFFGNGYKPIQERLKDKREGDKDSSSDGRKRPTIFKRGRSNDKY